MEANAWVMIPKAKKKGTECVLDMRPLVLCKNCKHYKDGKCFHVMRRHGLEPDWFCADGEEKDGEQE